MVMKPMLSDDQLLAAATDDAEAFAEFYRRHALAALKYLRYRTGDVEKPQISRPTCPQERSRQGGATGPHASPRGHGFSASPTTCWRCRGDVNDVPRELEPGLAIPPIADVDEELERADERLSVRLEQGLAAALLFDVVPERRTAVVARIVEEKGYGQNRAGARMHRGHRQEARESRLHRLGIALRNLAARSQLVEAVAQTPGPMAAAVGGWWAVGKVAAVRGAETAVGPS
jgi:hypothetical protein